MITLFVAFLLSSASAFVVQPASPRSLASASPSARFGYGTEDAFYHEHSISPSRKKRLAHEKALEKRFATGQELADLRKEVESLKENLKWAMKDESRKQSLTLAIVNKENRDPDQVYNKALAVIEELQKKTIKKNQQEDERITKWRKVAADARACIPRFQLDGLWVGNYGKHGYELINATYDGDTLVATKVTGDVNVPRGQETFSVDLSPLNHQNLTSIELSPESTLKWGIDKLDRFAGKGQVAKKGFSNANQVAGQFILFENHFSFVWVPTRHHVFFGRPTPEVTLKMLRDVVAKEDELENMRSHLERCIEFDLSTCIARSYAHDQEEPFRRISLEKELQSNNNGKDLKHGMAASSAAAALVGPSKSSTVGFRDIFNVQKWKSYIDDVLNKNEGNSA